MIVAAAVKTVDGRVYSVPQPGRHGDVMIAMIRSLGLATNVQWTAEQWAEWRALRRDHVSGFVTDAGEFLDRDQALAHVRSCGQAFVPDRRCSATKRAIPADEVIGGILTSEDLW